MRATGSGRKTTDAELNALVDELERAVQDLLALLAKGRPSSARSPELTAPRGGSDAAPDVSADPMSSAGAAGRRH